MAMDLKEIEKYIKEALPDAIVDIQDLAGDGNHYSATVTSAEFQYISELTSDAQTQLNAKAPLASPTFTGTAAVTGVATKYLSPTYSRIAAFIGCGNQTLRQIEAVLSVRDIETIKLFDLSEERANKLKDELNYLEVRQGSPVEIEVCNDLENCLWDSDIVTTLTPSRKPFIKHRFLKPVVHINAVGADAEGKRELDECVLANVDLVSYDEWVQCSHSGEIQYAKRNKISQIWCPIAEVVQGRIAKDSCKTTLFDATGLAIEDVATARYIYEKFNKKK